MDHFDYGSLGEEKKVNKKKIIICVIIALVIIALITVGTLYVVREDFRNWVDVHILQKEVTQDDVSTIEFNSDANVEICAYDRYIGILSKNSFNIYNSAGKEEKTLEVPINDVIFNSSGRFLGIAEKGGQSIYLISGQDIAWENKIEGSITNIVVNKNGYMAVVISDTSYKTVVSVYNQTGKELFKIFLASTKVTDVSISNDNKYLALAEVDTSSSVIQSNVKIVSIENAQTDVDNSVTYIFNAEQNKLLTSIAYQDKDRLICMYDDSICSIHNEQSTEILNFADKKVAFSSIKLNNCIATVEEKSSGLFTADSELMVINTATLKENLYTVHDVAKEVHSYGDIVGLNLGAELHFINTNGWLVKRYVANQEISNFVFSDSIAGIIYRDKIDVLSL